MAEIQFNEETEFSQPNFAPPQSWVIQLVLKTHLAETEEGARYVLLGLVIVCVIAALFFLFAAVGGDSSKAPPSPYKEGQNILVPPPGARSAR